MMYPTRAQSTLLRSLGVTAGLTALAAILAAPIRADMLGNAFLTALSNAGISYPQPASATALGQSVCPKLIAPDASFYSVASEMADRSGLSFDAAGVFTVVAVATYCPAMMAPLLQNPLSG